MTEPFKSQQSFQRLLKVVKENHEHVVPFVGAGLSIYGPLEHRMPTRKVLIEILRDTASEQGSLTKDDLDAINANLDAGRYEYACEIVLDSLPRSELRRKMREVFDISNRAIPPAINALVEIPWPIIVTTNYDRFIENASSGNDLYVITGHDLPELIQVIGRNVSKPYLVKIHGSIERFDTIVLSDSQYDKLIVNNPAYTRALEMLYAQSLLFLGFGMFERDFNPLLKSLTERYSGCVGNHFALLDERQRDTKPVKSILRLGIQPIWYISQSSRWEEDDCGHKSVVEFINLLVKDWQDRKASSQYALFGKKEILTRTNILTSETIRSIGKKYLPHLYIEREIDQKVNNFLTGSTSLFSIVDRAGSGKTNFLCNLCSVFGDRYIIFFIRPKFSFDLYDSFKKLFFSVTNQNFEDFVLDNKRGLNTKSKSLLKQILILIDGINEYPKLEAAKADTVTLLDNVLPYKIKVVTTCRDLFWRTFDEEFKDKYKKYTFEGYLHHSLGNFSDEGVTDAVDRYLTEFKIRGELKGQALEQCKFPLLLRFFCQAYEGHSVGPIYDIRLKALFDEYVARKTKSISEDLYGLNPKNILALLCDLAICLNDTPGKHIPFGELLKRQGLCSAMLTNSRLYNRILDENIIIEAESTPTKGMVISFVYDEFMEYLCAKSLLDIPGYPFLLGMKFRAWLVELLRKHYHTLRFSHLVEYMMAISRDDYKHPIWKEMFEADSKWHPTIVQALSKIPAEELSRTELSLLLILARYEGPNTSSDARRMAKRSLSEKFLYYGEIEKQQIWREVREQWGYEEQVKFIKDNFENLDTSFWKVLLHIAEDTSMLGQEELINFLDENFNKLKMKEQHLLEKILNLLGNSLMPSIRNWAVNKRRLINES